MPVTAERLRRVVGEGRRLVVKVGSSSLTGADGGPSTWPRSAPWSTCWPRVAAPAARSSSSRRGRSRPASARSASPAGLRPRDPAGGGQRRAGRPRRGLPGGLRGHGLTVGQVLLTADDVTRRTHYTNARRTLERLLELGIVPDRQRERHRRDPRDPVRRQRPAGRPRGRTSSTPTRSCC